MSPNHARAARLRERLEERLSRSPSEYGYPVSEWQIVERAFQPQFPARARVGLRGGQRLPRPARTPEEGTPSHAAGAVLNGLHEAWPIVYLEDAYGLARVGQTIVNATDGTLIRLFVDDEPFDLTTAKLLRFERVLDMQIGVLGREVEWETARGHRMRIRSRRLASLEHRHLAAMDYYDPLTAGDSTLSACIHSVVASEVGYPEAALEYFVHACGVDLADVHGNTADGIHIASCGGTWLALVAGFGGLREDDGQVCFSPRLPTEWDRLRFRVQVRGQLVEVGMTHEETTYRLVEGTGLMVHHFDEPLRLLPQAPVWCPQPAELPRAA